MIHKSSDETEISVPLQRQQRTAISNHAVLLMTPIEIESNNYQFPVHLRAFRKLNYRSARTLRGGAPMPQLLTIHAASKEARKPRAMPVPRGQKGCKDRSTRRRFRASTNLSSQRGRVSGISPMRTITTASLLRFYSSNFKQEDTSLVSTVMCRCLS